MPQNIKNNISELTSAFSTVVTGYFLSNVSDKQAVPQQLFAAPSCQRKQELCHFLGYCSHTQLTFKF